jgi:hypothetical protein
VYCSNCGKKSTGGKYCSSCGSFINAQAAPSANSLLSTEAAAKAKEVKAAALAQKKRNAKIERIRQANAAEWETEQARIFAASEAAMKRLQDEAEAKRKKKEQKKSRRQALRAKFAGWFLKLKTWQKLSAVALTLGLIAGVGSGIALAADGIGTALKNQAIADRIHTQQMDFKAYWQSLHALQAAVAAAQPVLDQANSLNAVAEQWGDMEDARRGLVNDIDTMTIALAGRHTDIIKATTDALLRDISVLGTQADADKRVADAAAAVAAKKAADDAAYDALMAPTRHLTYDTARSYVNCQTSERQPYCVADVFVQNFGDTQLILGDLGWIDTVPRAVSSDHLRCPGGTCPEYLQAGETLEVKFYIYPSNLGYGDNIEVRGAAIFIKSNSQETLTIPWSQMY